MYIGYNKDLEENNKDNAVGPVKKDGDDGLNGGELGAKSEGEEHHEEEDGPEGRDWHPCHGLGVGDECQAGA